VLSAWKKDERGAVRTRLSQALERAQELGYL
jgi:hypothetical protein